MQLSQQLEQEKIRPWYANILGDIISISHYFLITNFLYIINAKNAHYIDSLTKNAHFNFDKMSII